MPIFRVWATCAPIRREALGTSSAPGSKKMAENYTLFAIEEEIAV